MPCSDSSSSLALKIDTEEAFVSFDFAKITCGREITAETGYSKICKGRGLTEILDFTYNDVVEHLGIEDEEGQFILYLEWDALRTAVAQYLGIEDENIDKDRCIITSVEHETDGTEVALVILPPKELPKVLPCSLGDKQNQTS